MAKGVNRNVDWITDDYGEVVGYRKALNRDTLMPRFVDNGDGTFSFLGPDGTADSWMALHAAQHAWMGVQSARASNGVVRWGRLSTIAAAIRAATPDNPTTILRCGDSTTVGAGSGTATTWTAAAQRNCSAQFAVMSGGLVSNDSFIGDGGLGSSPGYSVYNPLVTLGNGWSCTTLTLGGQLFKFTAGGTGSMRYYVPAGTKKLRLYYVNSSYSCTVQTDVGTLGTFTSGSNFSIGLVEYNVQSGATYVEIPPPSTTAYFLAPVAINATQKAVLLNAGSNGATIASFTGSTNGYDPIPALKSIAPKLTVINLTINDANAPTAKATYQASLCTLVEAALLSGDVALEIGAVSNTANSTNGNLYDIRAAMMDVASAYNLTVLSMPPVLGGGFSNANAAGYMFDTWHPTYAGYTQEASGVWMPLLKFITS